MINEFYNKEAPIFRKFSVFGLNGYKDISLTCNSPVKIACADNGSGKTSLLNALYSVFEGKPSILFSMDFESLEFEWANNTSTSCKKSDLFGGLSKIDLDAMASDRFFVQFSVNKDDAIELLTKCILGDQDEAAQTKAFRVIYRDSPFDRQEVFERLTSITEPVIQTGEFATLHEIARKHLGDVSVLYLPTYRRIEADIPEFRGGTQSSHSNERFRSRSRTSKDAWDSTRLIFFGMADVESKINSIVAQIRKETLEAYSKNSGQTLEQLIENPSEKVGPEKEIFDIASIEVVLARVGKNTVELRAGLARLIQDGEIYQENRRELRRFLRQLLNVYAERREDELAIERFVEVVNSYVCPDAEDEKVTARSEKKLVFDKLNLDVSVINRITKKIVKLGHLSSGEKQVISIFARLMLDPKKSYLILIDEPELSLSLEWQQKLLPDICATYNCVQLVTITHSPFIFDNNLEAAAGTLDIGYRIIKEAN